MRHVSLEDNAIAVRASVLVLALGISEVYLKVQILKGIVPPHDGLLKATRAACGAHRAVPQTRIWYLNTLYDWRPDVAARCEAILQTLESFPLTAE